MWKTNFDLKYPTPSGAVRQQGRFNDNSNNNYCSNKIKFIAILRRLTCERNAVSEYAHRHGDRRETAIYYTRTASVCRDDSTGTISNAFCHTADAARARRLRAPAARCHCALRSVTHRSETVEQRIRFRTRRTGSAAKPKFEKKKKPFHSLFCERIADVYGLKG